MLIESPQLAREMLRVINISKVESAYRLRLAPETESIEWLSVDEDKEVVLYFEPESTWTQRLYNLIFSPLVPEDLL